ncbi:MAG: extracellular solute-binding protein [Treponema sp.]|jgi:multiple sugar transport system substrate-binding protein|nr:extracellular solute-binding protein [Treponema sp.]
MNYKRIDRILLFTALAILAAALVFKAAASSLKTTLVFSQWWQTGMEPDTLESLIREFEGLHPGIRVRLDTRPYGEIRDRLNLYLKAEDSGGEAAASPEWQPDVLGLDQRWLPELTRRGVLEPLEAHTGAGGEGFIAAPQDEKQAVHLVSLVSLLYFNIDMLRAAGFNRPPKTRAEFISYAEALAGPDRSALTLALDPADSRDLYRDVLSWFWASGAKLTGGRGLRFADPPFIETLTFLNALYQRDCLSRNVFTTGGEAKLDAFINRRTAMMIGPVQYIKALRQARAGGGDQDFFGISAVPVPGSYIGSPVFASEDWYAGIPRSSRHKEEAWMWLAFLARRRSFLTGRASGILSGTESRRDPLYAKAADIYELGEGTYEPLDLEELPAFETILLEELKALFEEARTPQEAAAEMQRRWDLRAIR